MMEIFENELVLQFCMLYGSVITSACLFGFIFSIKHKNQFSSWARLSIFTASLSSLVLSIIPITGVQVIHVDPYMFIAIKIFFQTAIAINVYTMIRTQWTWQEDFRLEIICEKKDCPGIVRINNDKSED